MSAHGFVDLTHYALGGFVVTVNDDLGSVPVWWGAGFVDARGWAETFRAILGIAQPVRDLVTGAGHG
jgi:hypothetical protein